MSTERKEQPEKHRRRRQHSALGLLDGSEGARHKVKKAKTGTQHTVRITFVTDLDTCTCIDTAASHASRARSIPSSYSERVVLNADPKFELNLIQDLPHACVTAICTAPLLGERQIQVFIAPFKLPDAINSALNSSVNMQARLGPTSEVREQCRLNSSTGFLSHVQVHKCQRSLLTALYQFRRGGNEREPLQISVKYKSERALRDHRNKDTVKQNFVSTHGGPAMIVMTRKGLLIIHHRSFSVLKTDFSALLDDDRRVLTLSCSQKEKEAPVVIWMPISLLPEQTLRARCWQHFHKTDHKFYTGGFGYVHETENRRFVKLQRPLGRPPYNHQPWWSQCCHDVAIRQLPYVLNHSWISPKYCPKRPQCCQIICTCYTHYAGVPKVLVVQRGHGVLDEKNGIFEYEICCPSRKHEEEEATSVQASFSSTSPKHTSGEKDSYSLPRSVSNFEFGIDVGVDDLGFLNMAYDLLTDTLHVVHVMNTDGASSMGFRSDVTTSTSGYDNDKATDSSPSQSSRDSLPYSNPALVPFGVGDWLHPASSFLPDGNANTIDPKLMFMLTASGNRSSLLPSAFSDRSSQSTRPVSMTGSLVCRSGSDADYETSWLSLSPTPSLARVQLGSARVSTESMTVQGVCYEAHKNLLVKPMVGVADSDSPAHALCALPIGSNSTRVDQQQLEFTFKERLWKICDILVQSLPGQQTMLQRQASQHLQRFMSDTCTWSHMFSSKLVALLSRQDVQRYIRDLLNKNSRAVETFLRSEARGTELEVLICDDENLFVPQKSGVFDSEVIRGDDENFFVPQKPVSVSGMYDFVRSQISGAELNVKKSLDVDLLTRADWLSGLSQDPYDLSEDVLHSPEEDDVHYKKPTAKLCQKDSASLNLLSGSDESCPSGFELDDLYKCTRIHTHWPPHCASLEQKLQCAVQLTAALQQLHMNYQNIHVSLERGDVSASQLIAQLLEQSTPIGGQDTVCESIVPAAAEILTEVLEAGQVDMHLVGTELFQLFFGSQRARSQAVCDDFQNRDESSVRAEIAALVTKCCDPEASHRLSISEVVAYLMSLQRVDGDSASSTDECKPLTPPRKGSDSDSGCE